MVLKKIRAFTLFEIVMVAAIIWILTLWMTTYMWNSWERAKIIEAQWCASAIWWELKNYVYNALTSKILKTGDDYISPDYYFIDLRENDSFINICDNVSTPMYYCNNIILWYSIWELNNYSSDAREEINIFKKINTNNICHNWKIKLWYFWSWNTIQYMIMNKWFTQKNINQNKVFYLEGDVFTHSDYIKLTTWDIIVALCYDKECESRKHIGRRHIDARSRTIEFQKCKFYNEDDPTICKTREDEQDDET